MCGSFKNDQFLVEKYKNSSPILIGTISSIKFVLDTKVQNSAYWNISNLDVSGNSVALNMSSKSEWVPWYTKIYQKCKLHGGSGRS